MKTFQEVADEMIPNKSQASRYVYYMKARWSEEEETQCATGYAQEWAERFNMGVEFSCSDSLGQNILEAIRRKP